MKGEPLGKLIYLDHAATTRMLPEVLESMMPCFTELYGNPSGSYSIGAKAKRAISESRETIAHTLGAKPEEIYFTSGGTESDNWALKGIAEAYAANGRHIITSRIEHHAVLQSCRYLESRGYEITYLDVNENGLLITEQLKRAIRPDTILVSVMCANNEVGSLQPIREIGAIARQHGVLFHTDAVQAYGQIPIQVEDLNIDLLSASGHKIGGPKGTGFLFVRRGVKTGSFFHGGVQERKRRAGTENVPGIAGLARAAEIACSSMNERASAEAALRDYLIDRVLTEIPFTRINGHRRMRLPGNANFSFQFIDGEALLILLDMEGICASGGAACAAGSRAPSHVLTALGLPEEMARSSIRLTLGTETTKEDLDFVIEKLKEFVECLRSRSPLYKDYIKN